MLQNKCMDLTLQPQTKVMSAQARSKSLNMFPNMWAHEVWSLHDCCRWQTEATSPVNQGLLWGPTLGVQLQQHWWASDFSGDSARSFSHHFTLSRWVTLLTSLKPSICLILCLIRGLKAQLSACSYLCTQSIFLSCLTCGACGTAAWTTWWYFWGSWRDVYSLRLTFPWSTQIHTHVEKCIAPSQASVLQH